MANAFQKAKAAAATEPTAAKSKAKKETLWLVGNDPTTSTLAEAVSELVELHAEAKAIETKADVFKTRLVSYARNQWQTQFGSTGVSPETPMKIVNRETGQSVTFVVQDRSQGHKVTDDVYQALEGILGPPGVQEAIFTQDQFGFDPVVMAAPTANDATKLVQDVIGDELGKMQDRLVKQGILTEAQANGLIVADEKRTYRPGFLVNLPRLCGNSVARFVDALGTVGSAIVSYVKAG